MKKAFTLILVVSALIFGYTFHPTQNAVVTNPDPSGISSFSNM